MNSNKTEKSTDVVAFTTSLPIILYNKQAKNELILITIYQNTVTSPTAHQPNVLFVKMF